MLKRIISVCLMATLMCTPLVVSAEMETRSHVHLYDDYVYDYTEQDGSYTHTYVSGYNPNTGEVIHDDCFVICEIEHYTWRCIVDGCYATNGDDPVYVETHGSCGE